MVLDNKGKKEFINVHEDDLWTRRERHDGNKIIKFRKNYEVRDGRRNRGKFGDSRYGGRRDTYRRGYYGGSDYGRGEYLTEDHRRRSRYSGSRGAFIHWK